MEETDLGDFKHDDEEDVEMEMEMEDRVKASSPLSDLPASSDSKSSALSDGVWSTPSSPLSSLSSIAHTSELEVEKLSKDEESGDEEDGEYELDEGERSSWIVSSRPIHPLPRRLVPPSSLKRKRAPPRSSLNLSQAASFNRNAPSPEAYPLIKQEEEEIYHVGNEDDRIVRYDGSVLYLTRAAFEKDAKEIFMRDSLGIRPELKNT